MPEEEYLTFEQAAAFLNVTPRTLTNLVNTKVITPHKSKVGRGRGGRRTYFVKRELEPLKIPVDWMTRKQAAEILGVS